MRIILSLILCCMLCSCVEVPTPEQTQPVESKYITVPLGDCKFVDIAVPEDAVLEQTNHFNSYIYDKLTIMKQAASDINANEYEGVLRNSKQLVSQQFGDWYIYASSIDGYLDNTIESFKTAKVYTKYPELGKMEMLDSLPEEVVQPDEILTLLKASNDKTIYVGNGYVRSSVKYQPMSNVIPNAIAQFYVYGEVPAKCYQDANTMYVESANFYVGIKRINSNTTRTVYGHTSEAKPYVLAMLKETV